MLSTRLRLWSKTRWSCTFFFFFFFFLLLLTIVAANGKALSVSAQPVRITWTRARNLSDTPQNSEYPDIVADKFGYVHVLWGEDVGGAPFQGDDHTLQAGNSILYARWDGESWTSAVDVLRVPGESIARFVSVSVDAENRLHAVWTGQSSLYYSGAPAWLADSAHAWTPPIAVTVDVARTAWESDIVADSDGNLHIVYAASGGDPAIYHIRSLDGGVTWGSESKLSRSLARLEVGFAMVKVIADEADCLHAVWQAAHEDGNGQAVYYARSIDGGQAWSAPLQWDYRNPGEYEVAYPYLVNTSGSELHVIYIGGADGGRDHRISRDGGKTWSDPYHIITNMEGVNGYVFPLVDGDGQMHLIANLRTKQQVGGIFYSSWTGRNWLPPVRIDLGDEDGSAHFTSGTVRLGNELHMVWSQQKRGEVGYVSGILPSVSQAQALPVLSAEISIPVPSAVVPREAVTLQPEPVERLPVPSPAPALISVPDEASSFPIDPMIVGPMLSLLLVGGVVAWARLRSR